MGELGRLKNVDWSEANTATTVKGDTFDTWWGCDYVILTQENIKALNDGKVLHTVINGEYAVLIKLEAEDDNGMAIG